MLRNDWFVKSPDQVQLNSGDHGAVRCALTRGNCDWVRACPAGVREKYWSCLVGVTEAGVERCKKEAALACGLIER